MFLRKVAFLTVLAMGGGTGIASAQTPYTPQPPVSLSPQPPVVNAPQPPVYTPQPPVVYVSPPPQVVYVSPPVVYRPYPYYPPAIGIGFGRGGVSVGGVLPVGPVVVGGYYHGGHYYHHR